MANNALIKGAAQAGKRFLDVGKAAAQGFAMTGSTNSAPQQNDRVAKNKAIQNKVNSYMNNLKTDMDFTSFSPEETRTMRNFLMSQRSEYANAAKAASKFDDTTSSEYMEYVDIMQGVNNSFKNMASQLGAYKKGKLDYAENQLDGMYSNGNGEANSNAARIYGFADNDKDGRKDIGVNAPFKILKGGNLGFDLEGQEVAYNDMEQPFFKDSKLALGILKDNETIYNKGTKGGEINPEMLESYRANLDDQLQNQNALKSLLYDFKSELNTQYIADSVDNGSISMDEARTKVVDLLVNARKDVFAAGKKQYDINQNKAVKLTPAQQNSLLISNNKLKSLKSGDYWVQSITDKSVYLDKDGDTYYKTNAKGEKMRQPVQGYTLEQAVEMLGLQTVGFKLN
tara:strand:+ start:2365 stop:3558 length:1194 start_codon:yes stop_codon:yes gene_type:complete